MDNIVIRVAKEAGGLAKLADMHGVSYQAAWLWAEKGYFPLKQMGKVIENFPKITSAQLMAAYQEAQYEA